MNKSELLARTEHEDQIRSVRSDDASNRLTEEVRQTAARPDARNGASSLQSAGPSEQTMQELALTIKHSRWLVQESGRIRQVHKYQVFMPHKTRKELA